MKSDLKDKLLHLLTRRLAPLLVLAGAAGFILLELQGTRKVDMIFDLGTILEKCGHRPGQGNKKENIALTITASSQGKLVQRLDVADLARSSKSEARKGRYKLRLNLPEDPVEMEVMIKGVFGNLAVKGMVDPGKRNGILLVDFSKSKMNYVEVPDGYM
ncbi:MAG: hypothetical protein GXP49_00965 [Deltaproteobacteria bacterium]|nr:hypothetical protein [Deltaproteobacteria bacterium]